MDPVEASESMDFSKLKVPELRKELKSRGLTTAGNKTELLERLQSFTKNKSDNGSAAESVDDFEEDLLNEDDDEHLDESDLNDLDSPVEAPAKMDLKRKSTEEVDTPVKPPPKKIVLTRNVPEEEESPVVVSEEKTPAAVEEDDKKVIKLSNLSAKERLEMRAKKFGVPLSGDAKKEVRAERFNAGGDAAKKTGTVSIASSVPTVTVDVLKQRAERFGVSVSTALTKLENAERLEKRKERFGATANGNGTTPVDKAKQRLERFKEPVK